MRDSMHPDSGARYVFERETVSEDGGGADYRVELYTPTTLFTARARLTLGKVVELEQPDDIDPRHAKRLMAHARQLATGAEKRQRDGLPPWPGRIMRWRAD